MKASILKSMVLDLSSDEAASVQVNESPAVIEGLREPMLISYWYEKKEFLQQDLQVT